MQFNHYLNFQGETEAAFTFYKTVFGGEFAMLSRYADISPKEDATLLDLEKIYILHVSLPINEYTILMGSDTTEHFCAQSGTPFIQGTNHYISINLDKTEQTEAHLLFNDLSQNGQIEMPLDKTFWEALYGTFTDQFGIRWMINCQLELRSNEKQIKKANIQFAFFICYAYSNSLRSCSGDFIDNKPGATSNAVFAP